MSKTLVGIVTFGNLDFTKLTIQSIKETTKNHDVDFFVVVGKPGDIETLSWLNENEIHSKVHNENRGFPSSLNDIYDWAWKEHDYDYLIIAGNDVVAYPNCVDELIDLADHSDYECISSLQYDVKDLTAEFPEVAGLFYGSSKIFEDFSQRPWEKFQGYNSPTTVEDMRLFDIQNLCLYKKSVFDKIGYTDVAFYPAYFVDNDYARRIVISGLRCCSLSSARFFHFWSRTIHQGSGGSNDRYFKNNEKYYKMKWGGPFGSETHTPDIRITDRTFEDQIINHWRSQ